MENEKQNYEEVECPRCGTKYKAKPELNKTSLCFLCELDDNKYRQALEQNKEKPLDFSDEI